MAATEGFSIEISSRYDGWWRYNAALMCGCFDAGDERIGFASAESHVADVGANLTAKPADMAGDRKVLRSEKRLINQWSGASVEMRVDRQDK